MRPRHVPTEDEKRIVREHIRDHSPSFPPPMVLLYPRGMRDFAAKIGTQRRNLRAFLNTPGRGCDPLLWEAICERVPELGGRPLPKKAVNPDDAIESLARESGLKPDQVRKAIEAARVMLAA